MGKFPDIESYVNSLGEPLAEVARKTVEIIDAQKVAASRAVWYGHPVWSIGPAPANGPICYIKAYPQHVTLGFWSGQQINDVSRKLRAAANGMASVKLRAVQDIDNEIFADWLRQARLLVANAVG